jgi:hypothetical protein
MKKILVVLIAIVFTFSCAQKSESIHESAEALDTSTEVAVQNQLAKTPNTDLYSDGKARLIKTAHYRFQVKDVKTSTEAIEHAVKKFPAYISSSSLHLENPILENKISIRVESQYFYELLREIDTQALFVHFRNVQTDDVSKQIVDLESRLKTKREVEVRYMNILRSKAGTIEELLEAEKQIGSLHEEIEATISRINYLKEQVSYSTINLEFYQTITEVIAQADNTGAEFGKAFTEGFQLIIKIGIVLTYIWPFILLGACTLFFLKWRKRKTQGAAL